MHECLFEVEGGEMVVTGRELDLMVVTGEEMYSGAVVAPQRRWWLVVLLKRRLAVDLTVT